MSAVLMAPLVIPSGGTTSGYVQIGGAEPCGIYCPAALDGTAFTFLVKHDVDDTPVPLNGLSVTQVDGEFVALTLAEIAMFLGVNYLAIQSNGTESADRTINISRRVMA